MLEEFVLYHPSGPQEIVDAEKSWPSTQGIYPLGVNWKVDESPTGMNITTFLWRRET